MAREVKGAVLAAEIHKFISRTLTELEIRRNPHPWEDRLKAVLASASGTE